MLLHRPIQLFGLVRAYWLQALVIFALVFLEEAVAPYIRPDRTVFSMASVGLLVTALSIFLVFRVNEAYGRWWEARTIWGGIVNASRSFARQVTSFPKAAGDDASTASGLEALRRELVYRQIAWVNALRLSLRREESWEELAPFLEADELAALEKVANKPAWLLRTQGVRLAEAQATGHLTSFDQLALDRTMTALHDAQGGCERIKNTPFPERVVRFTQLIAWGLAAAIPISIIQLDARFDVIELVVVPFMMLAFIITERLGAELKDPFENRPNDTPMTALCRTIEIDLRQQLGERDVPSPIEPVGGVLM